MTESSAKAALFKAMAAVLGEVDRVPKSGENAYFHYRYATEADLMDMLRPILAKHGLALFVSVDSVEMREGGPQGQIARVGLDVTIGCAEGGESITTRWYGEGQDKADKALYKAYTGAVKYFAFKTFLVSTGDDPEDEPMNKVASTPRQVAPVQNAPAAEQAPSAQAIPDDVRAAGTEVVNSFVKMRKGLQDAKTLDALRDEWKAIGEFVTAERFPDAVTVALIPIKDARKAALSK